MKIQISTSAPAAQNSKIAKLRKTVQDLTAQLADAKEKLDAAEALAAQKSAALKKESDMQAVKARGKVTFIIKSSTGRSSTFLKFAEAFKALESSIWRNGKPCTLTAVTKDGEELLAQKTQKKNTDKPLAAVYVTAKGRVFKNAAGM